MNGSLHVCPASPYQTPLLYRKTCGPCKVIFALSSENPIDNVRSDCGPSTKNSCVKLANSGSCRFLKETLTSIAHFLPELLPICVELALLTRRRAAPTLTDIHWHITIVGLHRGRRGLVTSQSTLLIYDSNVASREYAFHSSTFVSSFCPVGVHKLSNQDAVVGQDG